MSEIKKLIKFRPAGAPWENEQVLLNKLNEVIDQVNELQKTVKLNAEDVILKAIEKPPEPIEEEDSEDEQPSYNEDEFDR